MKGVVKGDPGYFSRHKRAEIIKTVLAFAIVAVIYVVGLLVTHTQKNILTIVAILGVLPASRQLVSLIMLIPHKPLDQGTVRRIADAAGNVRVCYNMVFTTKEKVFPVAAIALTGVNVCGLMTDKTELAHDAEEHLLRSIRADGIQKPSVKLFTEEELFLRRLAEMSERKGEGESDVREERIVSLFGNLSL